MKNIWTPRTYPQVETLWNELFRSQWKRVRVCVCVCVYASVRAWVTRCYVMHLLHPLVSCLLRHVAVVTSASAMHSAPPVRAASHAGDSNGLKTRGRETRYGRETSAHDVRNMFTALKKTNVRHLFLSGGEAVTSSCHLSVCVTVWLTLLLWTDDRHLSHFG